MLSQDQIQVISDWFQSRKRKYSQPGAMVRVHWEQLRTGITDYDLVRS
jgi:hypothetical protein